MTERPGYDHDATARWVAEPPKRAAAAGFEAARFGRGPFERDRARVLHTSALRRLAAEGRMAEGEFLPGRRGTEWCDSEVLRLLRRRCLARLRKEAEPVPPEVLARFLPAWHGIGGGSKRRADAGAVLEVIERLGGAPVPASALETLVLPGRVPGYSPALLDELTSAGEIVWAGAGALPGGDGWLVLAPADGASLLLPEPAEVMPITKPVVAPINTAATLWRRSTSKRSRSSTRLRRIRARVRVMIPTISRVPPRTA